MSNTPFKYGDKIKLVKDHNGKPLKRPVYGYITCVGDCTKNDMGLFVETGMQKTGFAYLVRTSWAGGALWYSDAAIKHAGGVNRLGEWNKRLQDYHDAYAMKHGGN